MSRQDKFLTPKVSPATAELNADDDELLIDLRLRLSDAVDLESELLRRSARRPAGRKELTALARRIFEARRLRDKALDKEKVGLFGEPAWDMLLALYYLPRTGTMLSISGLSHTIEVAQTTGLRWQRTLMRHGLIELSPDCEDLRRRFVRLTERGRGLMDGYLTRLIRAEADASSD